MTVILNLAAKVHYYSDSYAVSVKKKQLPDKFFVSPLPFPEKEDTFVDEKCVSHAGCLYRPEKKLRKRYEIQSPADIADSPSVILYIPRQETEDCRIQGLAQRAASGC